MNLIEFKPEWLNTIPPPGEVTFTSAGPASRIPIIIAEDDVVSRVLLTAVLRSAGYDPVVTSNGNDAMSALRLQPTACLAIVDWIMPEMGGAEVCRRVRESEKPVHLIVVTARDTKKDAVEALDAGADDYLTKPFDRGELLARVRAGLRILEFHETLLLRAGIAEPPVPAWASLQMPL